MKALFAGFSILAVAILTIPIAIVVVSSFSDAFLITFPPKHYSLRWYRAFFADATFMDALFRVSLPLSIASGLTATALAFLSSVWLRFAVPRFENAWLAFMTMPLLVPHVIVGISVYLTLAAFRVPASLGVLFLAHVLIAMPYALRVIHSTMTGVEEQYFHATVSLGGSLSTFILKVLLPMTRGSVINAFVFGFVVSFGDINVSLFLAPPDTATFPVQLYSKILWDSDPSVAAGSAVQIVLISAMTLLMFRLLSNRR